MIYIAGVSVLEQDRNWRVILSGRKLLARHSQIAMGVIGDEYEISQSYEHLFETGAASDAVSAVVQHVLRMSEEGDVVYLVPGRGDLGDCTVAQIATLRQIKLIPGVGHYRSASQIQIVDAAELAMAEEHRPFDAGLAPIDTTVPTIVTNWYGTAILTPAVSRLRRVNIRPEALHPDANFEVFIDAVDHDAAPASTSGLQFTMASLRAPDGCPWDREQTAHSMLGHLRGEVEELEAAVERGDAHNQREELGDVLMNLVMLAQIAHEQDAFGWSDVVSEINAKMIRRHPHVFGNLEVDSIQDVYLNWQKIKAAEKSTQ